MTALPAPAPRVPQPRRGIAWASPALGLALFAALGLVPALLILRAAADGPLPLILTAAATAALAAWVVVQDLATLTIPDLGLLALAAVASAWRWSQDAGASPGQALGAMALDAASCGGALLLFREGYYRLKGVDGLGLGDVKLAAAGALLVGAVGFAWALFAASLAALAAVAASRVLRRTAAAPDRIALGAVLAPALWLVFVAEQAMPRLGGG